MTFFFLMREQNGLTTMRTCNSEKKLNYSVSHWTKCMRKCVCDRILLNKVLFPVSRKEKENKNSLLWNLIPSCDHSSRP